MTSRTITGPTRKQYAGVPLFGAYAALLLTQPLFVPIAGDAIPSLPVSCALLPFVVWKLFTTALEPLDKLILCYATVLLCVLLTRGVVHGGFHASAFAQLLFALQNAVFLFAVILRRYIRPPYVERVLLGTLHASVLWIGIILVENRDAELLYAFSFLGLPVYHHSNYFPAVLCMISIAGTGVAMALRHPLQKILALCEVALILYFLWLGHSETSKLVAYLGVTGVLMCALFRRVSRVPRVAAGFLVLVVGATLGVIVVQHARSEGKIAVAERTLTLHSRTRLWNDILEANLVSMSIIVLGRPDVELAVGKHQRLRPALADNQYARLFAMQGVIGIGLYVCICIIVLTKAYSCVKYAFNIGDFTSVGVAVSVILALGLLSMTMSISAQPISAIVLWFLVGLMYVRSSVGSPVRRTRPKLRRMTSSRTA